MSFSPRQSPFKRPDSSADRTPSTVVAASPAMTSPTKNPVSMSPAHDRQSPFVRRPSQLGATDRNRSPFTRPPSRLIVADTPTSELVSDNDPFVVKSGPPTAVFDPRPSSAPQTTRTSTYKSPPVPSHTFDAPPPLPRTNTSSTVATVRPLPQPTSTSPTKPTLPAFANAGNYTHIPPALLRSMRESFEVLDTTSSNTITKSDLASILEQLGLDASPSSLATFFPASGPQTLSLSRFLDLLTTPMQALSDKDELLAAFAAFDVDDSGQIDLPELREALLRTAPERGGRLQDAEVDGILREFCGRRAFGAKGVSGKELGGGGRGEVFRYRDFVATISGQGQADGVQV